MILNGDEIIKYHDQGLIGIDPWDLNKVGVNSYDVCLDSKLLKYRNRILDPRCKNDTKEIIIQPHGFMLEPGMLVLGSTKEYCTNKANNLVPMIEGRSSIGRLGISIHVTAGFGDIGFCGKWTLEIFCVIPVILYDNMPIGQLYWIKTEPSSRHYSGKYHNQAGPLESCLYKEYGNGRGSEV